MEPKYYTPAIEEFYVGFEYYWRNSDGYTQDELIPNTIKSVEQIIDIQNPIYEIKVKALDREDIEDCGWTYDKFDRYECHCFVFKTEMNWTNSETVLYFTKCGRIAILTEEAERLNRVFFGTIRNKSELKMIMRMIGIKP